MNLIEILSEIKKVKPFAEEVIENGPRETMTGRLGRKNQSVETLKRLKREYTNTLRQTAAFIFVVGSKREEFLTLGVDSYKCFSADPESFFSELADRVPQALYLGKESLSNTFDVLGRHLEDKAAELDIVGYPQLIFRQEYARHLNTRQDFIDVIKQAITEQIGGELVGIQTAKLLTEQAIEKNHSAKITPVLLASGDQKFVLKVAQDLERITSRVFVIVAGDTKNLPKGLEVLSVPEVTADSVKKTLKAVSLTLTKK